MSKTENELAEILANLISSIEVADERKPGQFFTRELMQLGYGKDRSHVICKELSARGLIKPVKITYVDAWGQRKKFAGWEVVDNAATLDQR